MNFDALLRPILDQIVKLWARVELMPVVRWATITQVTPNIRIRVDGDPAELPITPQVVVGGLVIGDRVVCIEQHRRMIVLQVAGGRAATQVEVDAGTDTRRYVTPSTLRKRSYAAYAEAVGSGMSPASGAVTVTFPVGKFTVPPEVFVNPRTHPNILQHRMASDPTTTSFQVQLFTSGGAQVASGFGWHAIQMTEGSAAG